MSSIVRTRRIFLWLVLISLLYLNFNVLPGASQTKGNKPEASFSSLRLTSNDRILILAPHPDDESIGTAGVIQDALSKGAKVKIAVFTNGDNNEPAFIVYEKRIVFKKKEFLNLGELRRKETLAAMNSLGLKQDDIVFLGYPDFGTMQIMLNYWGDTRTYRSMLPRQTKVPYPEALSPNAPYVGESILKDLKKVLIDFKPTKIFVSHPADVNRDHRALYLFLRVALWDLEGKIPSAEVFPCIIHVVGWPKPRGYHPDLELNPPSAVGDDEIRWDKLGLTDKQIKAKYNAITFYKTQIEYDPPYLFTFARKNELFGDYEPVSITGQANNDISWQSMVVAAGQDPDEALEKINRVSDLAYALKDGYLYVKLVLRREVKWDFGIYVYLLGYSKRTDFAKMPKLQLSVGLGGLHIRDKKQTISIDDARLVTRGKELVFKIPVSALGDPDYILACAKTGIKDLPQDATAWRVLELK